MKDSRLYAMVRGEQVVVIDLISNRVICECYSLSNAITIANRLEAFDGIVAALRDLTLRCDGAEGVRPDGSNIDTQRAHATLINWEN
jgi:hypothetical protein